MPALRFGRPGRQLFGFHHPPVGVAPRATSLLLCNPFSPDALRAQRMFRMLAERLARNGFHVLRFDYFATGDSDGDDELATLTEWQTDIVAAHTELMARSRATRAGWIGLGLGAALAARASLKLDRPLALLALWEPVLDTARYLDGLRTMHREYFPSELATVDGKSSPVIVEQLLGLPISRELQNEFGTFSQPMPAPVRADRVVVLASATDTAAAKTAQDWLRASSLPDFVAATGWASTDFDDMIGSAVVYNDIIQNVADTLKTLP